MRCETDMEFDKESNGRRGSEAELVQRRVRSLTLGWTDPESGDRLTAQIQGGEDLLPELERQGFELLGIEPGSAELQPTSESTGADGGASDGITVVSQLAVRARRYVSRLN